MDPRKLPSWAQQFLAVVAILISAISVVVAVDNGGDGGGGKPDKINVTVNAAPGDGQPTKTIEVPISAVEQARDDLDHKDLEAAPPNAQAPTDAQIEQAADVQQKVKALPEAGAVIGFKGCATRIIPVNFSSRNGARATEQVMHYTVSANRPGWSDVNAIVALFSVSARQASSNFVIDTEGNCAYIVPIESKAWTQAGGNPWSVSYEVIDTGSESNYLESAGFAKLRSVVQQVAQRTGIPLRRGAVSSSCTPISAGIVQHKDFGLCGGGHVDITPFSIDAVVNFVSQTGPVSPLTKQEEKVRRGACHPKGTGHTALYWALRARDRVQHFNSAHKQGRSWRYHDIGKRRKLLARTVAGKC